MIKSHTLFPKKSLFPIEPRIFGSTCYVRDVRPSVTKLDPKALKFVQEYSKHQETKDTCPAPTSSLSDPPSDLDLPIGLRKGKRQCKSIYSIANFVSYDHLSPSLSAFVASLDSVSIPKTVKEALNHPGWYNAMLEEIQALEVNHTWNRVEDRKSTRLNSSH